MGMSEDYNIDKQKLIVEALISNGELLARCQNILQPSFFHKQMERTVKFILNFAEEYKSVPTVEQIFAESGVKLTLIEGMNEEHQQYFLDEIEQFVRNRALTQAILSGAELLEKGEYGGIEKMVKDALAIGLHKDLGIEYFEDPKARLLKLKDDNGTMSTGWLTLDQKIYNVGRGELLLFAAPSGGGKSVALQNLAINMALQGYNCIFITLELSEGLCAKRMDSMVSGVSTSQIYKKLDEVELSVRTTAKQAGKITIKKLPGSITNARDIKSYLREYQIQQGIKPDVLLVDYLDLMMPNDKRVSPSDLFVKDKYISEELRSLAEEFNLLCASASQFNRSAIDSVEFNHSHIAGGISKIQTADNAIGIFNSARSRERGEIEFQLLKTRNSGGADQKITLGYDIDTLRISDLDVSKIKAKDSRSNILDKINRKPTTQQEPDETVQETKQESTKAEDPIARAERLKNLVKKSQE